MFEMADRYYVRAMGALLLMACLPARADVFTVTTSDDAGPTGLRAALTFANAHPAPPFSLIFR